MADGDGRFFENWKVSDFSSFLIMRDVPMCDLPKVSLVQNCYLAVSLGLQPNNSKSPNEYAQDIYQSKRGKLLLDGSMIWFPDPDTLHEGWEDSPSSLPNSVHSATENYFDKSKWKKHSARKYVIDIPYSV